jgi:DNA-binding NarL/FixJ family response regulator
MIRVKGHPSQSAAGMKPWGPPGPMGGGVHSRRGLVLAPPAWFDGWLVDVERTSPEGWRALVVDEWALFRQGVRSVLSTLGVVVVDDVAGTADALVRLWSAGPELLVAGSPAQGNLADLVTRAKQAQPKLAVLALLPAAEASQLRPVLAAGADSVLTRTVGPGELEDAVRRLAAGERVLTAAAVLTGMVESDAPSGPAASPESVLTAKEREVLWLLAQDKSNRQIAADMVVSEATVKSHLGRLYGKLGVSGRREAVRRAMEIGLLT